MPYKLFFDWITLCWLRSNDTWMTMVVSDVLRLWTFTWLWGETQEARTPNNSIGPIAYEPCHPECLRTIWMIFVAWNKYKKTGLQCRNIIVINIIQSNLIHSLIIPQSIPDIRCHRRSSSFRMHRAIRLWVTRWKLTDSLTHPKVNG